jgi:hypothetical protein
MFKKFTDIKKVNEEQELPSLSTQVTTQAVVTTEQPTQVVGVEQQAPEQQTEQQNENTPVKLFSKIFESKVMAEVFHLQVRGDEGSHAAHKAMEIYYKEATELLDDLIEVFQGQYDIIEGYDIIDTKNTKDKIEYFMEVVEFVKSNRYTTLKQEDAHIQAIVDEVVNSLYKTLYRLRFNK